ncbi:MULTISPECIES: prepilin peptidase [unclassified Ruegeria]|uniref:A24 family peptidase n=1 Tax=unclassified Ruegeria TaxID=2625375 RepID=UPI001489C17E|nr:MULTISPECIES: prepilin peptidase [unclassified Ruegeria]
MPDTDWQNWLALWLFAPLFVAMAWTDFTQLRIPNTYCIVGLILFVAAAPFLTWNELLLRLLIAGACFVICFGLFAINWLGGGDAKMLPIVFLAVPSTQIPNYLFLFAAAMAVGLVGMALFRRLARDTSPRFKSTAQSREFPMGIAIGSAGLVLIAISVAELTG